MTTPPPDKQGHSPLPWVVSSSAIVVSNTADALKVICSTVDFKEIDRMPLKEAMANAKMIVRAVNSHQMLLDALIFSRGRLHDILTSIALGVGGTREQAERMSDNNVTIQRIDAAITAGERI